MSPATAMLGEETLRAQWAEFFALLALQQREDPAAHVTVDRVHRLASWRGKRPESVGKEVRRKVAALAALGFGEVVSSPARSRTRAWRLGMDARRVRLSPSASAVAAWLDERTCAAVDHLAWGRELQRLVEASIALRQGRGTDARRRLGQAPGEVRDVALQAWRALTEGRAAYLADGEDAVPTLDALIDAWASHCEPAGRAVEARLRSSRAMQKRFDDPPRTRAVLSRLVAACERAGDAGSLGVLLNVLGVVERRAGEPSRAFEYLLRAAGLLGIVGDYHTLQATLFNAAWAHHSVLKRGGRGPDALAFLLIDLCLAVCREFQAGNDSALAEITRAEWSLDVGAPSEAEEMLGRASRILDVSEASYDLAYFHQVRGRLRFDQGATIGEVERDLRIAARIYGQVGDCRGKRRAIALLHQLQRKRR